MLLTYIVQMIKLTRAHIGVVVLPSFFLGSLFALLLEFDFQLPIFLIGFLIIFFQYASASYINDYYDFNADQYNRQFGFSGGSGVLQKFPQLKKPALLTGISLLILSLTLTIILSLTTFIPLWSIGYISVGVFLSYFYSAPPVKMAYRGLGEFPHFIAGVLNTGWGYILLSGILDFSILIFAIPFSLHLLTVILLFEIPDKEADIHGGKQNFIVNHGRRKSFLVICIIFWIATFYLIVLALIQWYSQYINFWIPVVLSIIPTGISSYFYVKKHSSKKEATTMAIRTALSLFAFSSLVLLYFFYLSLKI